jgi:hypothetical protein
MYSTFKYSSPGSPHSLFAVWFHRQLSIRSKIIAAFSLVAAMVLGSGCLTMTAVGTIEDKKEERRHRKELMVQQASIEKNNVEDFHQHMNQEAYGSIPLYRDSASANSTKDQISLLEKIKTAQLKFGKVNAWKIEGHRYQSELHHLATTMKLEIITEHGKYQETLVWMFGDDNIMRLKDYTVHKRK